MSSITIICIQLILLINSSILIYPIMAVNQCESSSPIHLQSATYSHSLVLRVQPMHSNEDDYERDDVVIRKVLVREVIKIPSDNSQHQIQINDIVIIRINDNDDAFLDNSCWHLLRVPTVDIILFLNDTQSNEFDLQYPPVESTLRVRENIDAVLNHEPYPPQVLIKTRLDKAILLKDYSLQCNSRGNPLPRLLWSKKIDDNTTVEYYPLSKQCKTSCRIYTIQNKYQSILYFQTITLDDIGIYVCHAENPMNRTTTSVQLDIAHHHDASNRNLTCSNLKYCHDRGHCISINNQLKCLCDSRYFGEYCETDSADINKKQHDAILLFKSRFLAGFILVLIGCVLVFLALLSWFLARNNKQQQNKLKNTSSTKSSVEKPLISTVKETRPTTPEFNGTIPSPSSNEIINKSPSTPPATAHISHSPMIEKKPLSPPPHPPSSSSVTPRTVPQGALTRESSITTDDDDDGFFRHYQNIPPPVPARIDEEYEERFSFNMNQSEELGLGSLMNGSNSNDRALSHSHAVYYQPDYQAGLIKPLNIRQQSPQRYTKYVSSYSKFVLPRPVNLSPKHYQR